MKLPITSANWAKGRERGDKPSPEQIRESPEKRNYGGTDDVTMHELDKTKRGL